MTQEEIYHNKIYERTKTEIKRGGMPCFVAIHFSDEEILEFKQLIIANIKRWENYFNNKIMTRRTDRTSINNKFYFTERKI